MKVLRIVAAILLAATLAREARLTGSQPPQPSGLKTRNIILVTTDGLRWQEVFRGADLVLMNSQGGVKDVGALNQAFCGLTPEKRRQALMPFLWGTIAEKGQLFGDDGDEVRVTNGRNFSYPGYNEILTGWADPRINSNEKVPNRNVTVLEWLNRKDEFRRRIAAFCSWDVFPSILNRWRSKLRVQAAWTHPTGKYLTDEELVVSQLMRESPRLWEECCFDTFTFRSALGYLKRRQPRVMYIALGETDEWGHAGRYDQYLHAAHRVDTYLQTLWETVQSMPEYRDNTTIIVTTDHGRGNAPVEWKNHAPRSRARTGSGSPSWAPTPAPGAPSRAATPRTPTAA